MRHLDHQKIEIFLGHNIGAEGRVIDAAELADFIANIAATRDGLTVTGALGYWGGKPETSSVLTIIEPVKANEPDSAHATGRWIAEQLASRFEQSAVYFAITPCSLHQAVTPGTNYIRR